MLDKYTIYVHRKNQLLTNYQIQLFTLRPAGPLLISEVDWIRIPLHTYFKCRFTLLLWSNHFRSERVANRGGSSLLCKEGYRFSMGWCMREPYCPLSSAVCNATIPTLPLFEMSETARSNLLFIKFMLALYLGLGDILIYRDIFNRDYRIEGRNLSDDISKLSSWSKTIVILLRMCT
jgi:hypothetical protein